MKKLIYLLTLSFGLFTACDKFDEVHQEYIKNGEIIYSVRPDSVHVLAGYNRCALVVQFRTTPALSKMVIINGEERITLDIPKTSPIVSVQHIFNNTPEGAITLQVYSEDIDLNKSVFVNAFGSVYGEHYQDNILNRSLLSISKEEEQAILKFNTSPEKSVAIELSYQNNRGENITTQLPYDEKELRISDFVSEGEFSYKTLYVPEENCLDTIPTAEIVHGVFPSLTE